MTELEYQEHIRHTHNAYCKIVIRHAAIDIALRLRKQWEKELSLEYLMFEKFVPFSTTDEYFKEPEPCEEYPFTVCGQTVILYNGNLPPPSPFCRNRHRRKFFNTTSSAGHKRKSAHSMDRHAAQRDGIFSFPCSSYDGKWRGTAMKDRLLPYETIVKAHEGDPAAMQAVLERYAGFIHYFSHMNGYYNADMENYIKTKLIESQFKFRFDR